MMKKLKKFQWFWNTLSLFSVFYPKSNFKRLPKEIIIEPTNACNLRCPVCPTHFAMKRQRGFIDLELFKSIIDEFKNIADKPQISMNFSGEPLLHKEIDKLVDYAHSNGHKTFISTNATVLNKDLSKRLVNAGLDSIHLAMDGITKESHEAYRVGSDFDIVKKNIEDFLEARRELSKTNPFVSIQVLLTSFSENEVDKMIDWARKIGADNVNFKSLSMGSYTTDEIKQKYSYLLPTKEEYLRKSSNINKTICTVPIHQALVYWNGDLGLCCVDFDNVIKLPNIKEKGFIKTFLSDEVLTKRKLGFRKQLSLCKNCSLGNADFMGLNINLKEKND